MISNEVICLFNLFYQSYPSTMLIHMSRVRCVQDTDNGNLARRVSSGPGRPLSCLAWHPARNFAACGTRNGPVMIWGTDLKWEAFAPDFEVNLSEYYISAMSYKNTSA